MLGGLNISSYRGFGMRLSRGGTDQDAPRPDEPVAWFHATSDERAAALLDLANRLHGQRPEIPVLLTFDGKLLTGPHEARYQDRLIVMPLQAEFPAESKGFIAHWRPAVGLWAGGNLKPNLLRATRVAKVPMLLCDLLQNDLDRETKPWLPDAQRSALQSFKHIFAVGLGTASQLQRQGVAQDCIEVAPRLRESLACTPCAEEDLSDASDALADRPAWFAAGLCAAEAQLALSAHRQAARLAHRLLLVVTPADASDAELVAEAMSNSGLRWEKWTPGEAIGEFVQVLLVEDWDGMPLWFRLAPVCLMGGTLAPDGRPGLHPFEPAALGAAVLHGAHLSAHQSAYDRLDRAGGLRSVAGAEDLATAVLETIQPDRAAKMALAGWDVVTQSAWLTDQLLDIVQDHYDSNSIAHAHT